MFVCNKSIYVIDAYNNYVKFADAQYAAFRTGMDKDRILEYARGKSEHGCDFVFAFAEDIEEGKKVKYLDSFYIKLAADSIKSNPKKKNFKNIIDIVTNKNGKTIPLKKNEAVLSYYENPETLRSDIDCQDNRPLFVIKDIPKEKPEQIQNRYLPSAFYVMDRTFAYKKCFSQMHVANALGVDHRVVYKCLTGKQKMLNGLVFAYAKEIEIKNKRGKTVLNTDILKDKFKKEDTAIYSVDKLGRCQKFKNSDEVVEKLPNITKPILLHCLLGKQDATSEYAFFRSKDIEIKNPDYTIELDKAKINEAKLNIISKAVYLVGADGKYTRYNSQAEAARAIGVRISQISACLSGKRKTTAGYLVFYAKDIETYYQNGAHTINITKIREALEAANKLAEPIDIRKNGFYAINKEGECKKFYSIKSTENILNVNLTDIGKCLKGTKDYAGSYVYVKAEDIEIAKEDGTIELDKVKIAEKLSAFEKDAIYSIDKEGNCRYFKNQTEASKALDVPRENISKCILGKTEATTKYAFISANKMYIKGTRALNQELINEKVNYMNRFAFYAIDKDGNYTKFSNRDEASEILNIKRKTLSGCLSGNSKTSGGYVLINASEVETRLEDGTLFVDVKKIKSLVERFKN